MTPPNSVRPVRPWAALAALVTVCGVLLAAGAGSPVDPPRPAAKDDRPAPDGRAYAGHVRTAFLAWRGGDTRTAAAELDRAGKAAEPDVTHRYLTGVLTSGQPAIVCPAGSVTALAAAADGGRLVTGHADGTVAVWDAKTGKRLGSVAAHTGPVTHVGLGLNGTFAVTAGPAGPERSGTEQMLGWDVAADGSLGTAAAPRRALGKGVHCLAVSPDGTVVYAGGHNGLFLKLHLRDGAGVTVESAPGRPAVTAVSPDGARVLTADAKGSVRAWKPDLTADGALRDYDFPGGGVTALAASAYQMPIIGFADGTVFEVAPVCHPWVASVGGPVRWVASSPEGYAMSGPPGRVVIHGRRLYDLATGDLGAVRAGAFTADGKKLFTAGEDGVVRSWDVATAVRDRAATFDGRVVAAGVRPDGGGYVLATEHHVTRYQDGEREGRLLDAIPRPVGVVRLLADGSNRSVTLGGPAAVLREQSGNVGTELFRAAVTDDRTATSAALTPDAKLLAVGDDAGRVTVWAVGTREPAGTFDTGHRRPVRRVALSADGKLVAAPTATGVAVWDVATKAAVGTVPAEDPAVFCLVAGKVATTGPGGSVKVFAAAGKEEFALYGHVGRVTGLGASPDGRTLVSGGATGEVKFWDLRTGTELLGARRHSVAVTVVEFAAGGGLVLTAGEGQFAVWDGRR
jgi:WD40 repeat protein